jgi:hypothetical protein
VDARLVSDMFNNSLKSTVENLCSELSHMLANQPGTRAASLPIDVARVKALRAAGKGPAAIGKELKMARSFDDAQSRQAPMNGASRAFPPGRASTAGGDPYRRSSHHRRAARGL